MLKKWRPPMPGPYGIFPELKNVKVSHSWMGFVAYTFDELPHIGEYEGIHYAMGCCGSGVGMASYLGTRVAEQVLGRKEGDTAFDNSRLRHAHFTQVSRGFCRQQLLTTGGEMGRIKVIKLALFSAVI